MEPLKQEVIAAELGCSVMTVSRMRKAMRIHETRLDDITAIMVFVAHELQRLGVNATRACELSAHFAQEVHYVASVPGRHAWLVFIEEERADLVLSAITGRHLESILETHPLAMTIPLHACVARATERLATMAARRTAA